MTYYLLKKKSITAKTFLLSNNYFRNSLSLIILKAINDVFVEEVHFCFSFSSEGKYMSLKFFPNSKISFIAWSSFINLFKKQKISSSLFCLTTIHVRIFFYLFLCAVNMNLLKYIQFSYHKHFIDTQREKLCFIQFST